MGKVRPSRADRQHRRRTPVGGRSGPGRQDHPHEFAYGHQPADPQRPGSRPGRRRLQRRIGCRRRHRHLRPGHRHRRIHPGARRAERGRRPQTDLRPRPASRCHVPVLVTGPHRPDTEPGDLITLASGLTAWAKQFLDQMSSPTGRACVRYALLGDPDGGNAGQSSAYAAEQTGVILSRASEPGGTGTRRGDGHRPGRRARDVPHPVPPGRTRHRLPTGSWQESSTRAARAADGPVRAFTPTGMPSP